ncbi:MAG TPA: acetyl-CoA carboxylase biotin carboxyl carrier protein [Sedimentisphaerales bacterium]|nr:acetyl-CoA carboxylase biotin carboxyl carrier protein [Sedimentisphaerales bacterium]
MSQKKDKECDKSQENDRDICKINQILELMKDNDLVEVEIKHGEDKILLKRAQPQLSAVQMVGHAVPAPVAHAESKPKESENLVEIKSPIIGTFYSQPSPDSEPYVQIGSAVSPQTVICIVEAMKVMNEIKAETTGTIVQVMVENGQAVEYGQVLFKVRPN